MDRAIYEIVFSRDDDVNRIVGFELVYINPTGLKFKRNQVSQRVPQEVAEEQECAQKINFEKSELVVFSPPKDESVNHNREASFVAA